MNKRKSADNETNSSNKFIKRANIPAEEPVKENVIRYYLMPSLERLSALKIIIALWSQKHIQDEFLSSRNFEVPNRSRNREVRENSGNLEQFKNFSNLKEVYKKIEKKIHDTVLELPESHVIIEILSDLVNPIGQEIFDWIDYHEKYVFNTVVSLYRDIGVNYLDCLVWTTRGIIDYEETAKVLLTRGRFFREGKFNLACSYCLEDDIAIMPNLFDNARYYLHLCSFDEKPMVYFCVAKMTGDFTLLNLEVSDYNRLYETDYSFNECVFQILASKHRNNQVAIKFMWNMLSDDEKSRQIMSVLKYSKTDLKCFFLSQMNEAQQQQAFRAGSRYMLLCLLDDWLWKDYFLPTMHYVLNIISELDFFRVVEEIVKCMKKCYKKTYEYNRYKSILKEAWRTAPKRLKEFMFEYENGSRICDIFIGLLCERNKDMIQWMLREMSEIQKKCMMYSSHNHYHRCYWLILNDQIDVVKIFVDNTLSSERDAAKFKRLLAEYFGCDIVVHFMQNQESDKAEMFVQWIFASDDDKKDFKAKLAYCKVCDDILKSIVADNNGKNFTKLENFFQWCSSGNTQKVVQLKRDVYKVYFTKYICKLIKEDKYELLEQFLNWCFLYDEQEVDSVKCRFYSDHNYIQIIPLVLNLVEKNDNLQSLEKFVRWCFVKKRAINRFKKWILEAGSEGTICVCIELLCKVMFQLADDFVYWCCNSSQVKISKFKKDLLLYDNIKRLFTLYKDDKEIFEKIIKWFNPSIEVFIEFRKKFVDFHWLKDYDIAVLLIKNQKWNEVEQYIQWASKSDRDKRNFKEKLAYSRISDDILESIVADDNERGFVELENFFLWCSSENSETVAQLKGGMPEHYFTKVICKLIEGDKYQLLEQFLDWCFCNNKLQVKLFKRYFCDYHKYFEIVQFILNLVERNDQLKSLEKFVQWCFTENKEINRFKKFILEPGYENEVGVCIKLLCKDMLKLADEFVRWGCDLSQIQIGKLKNKLMLYEGVECVFIRDNYDDKTFSNIIKWFDPSFDIKTEFRKKFRHLGLIWMLDNILDKIHKLRPT